MTMTVRKNRLPLLADVGPATTTGPRTTSAAKPAIRHPDTVGEPTLAPGIG